MKCGQCGYCREICPIFKVILKETASPRAKGILQNNEYMDKLFYLCTMCGACNELCETNSEKNIRKLRAKLVEEGIELKRNKEIIENLKNHGHPFKKT